MRDLGDTLDVDELEHRIGRRLEKHGAGIRPHGRLPGGEIAAVDQRGLDAVARQQILDDVAAAAEQRAGRDHMVAGLELTEERGSDRRHAARRAPRGLGAFQRAHPRLEHGHGGVGVAAIDVAFLVALEAGLGLLGGCIDIARVEEDRLRGLAELASQRALMHELGRRMPGACALLLILFCRHGLTPSASCGHKKTRTLAAAKRPGSTPRASHGLLATCLTWLQAGRPNHHEGGLKSREGPRVKPSEALRHLVNPGEKSEVRLTGGTDKCQDNDPWSSQLSATDCLKGFPRSREPLRPGRP